MKNYWLIGLVVLFITGCEMQPKNSHPPVFKKVVIAHTVSDIEAGIDSTVFSANEAIRFCFAVTDEDGDCIKAFIIRKNENGEIVKTTEETDLFNDIDPAFLKEAVSTITITYLPGTESFFTVGSWSISVYCVDMKGNKSETVTKNFTVQ
jgi:hypothetical protein